MEMKKKLGSFTIQFSVNNDRIDVDKTDMLEALATFKNQKYTNYICNAFRTPKHMREKTNKLKTLLEDQQSLSLIKANAHAHIDNYDSLKTSSLFKFAGVSALIGAMTWVFRQLASILESILEAFSLIPPESIITFLEHLGFMLVIITIVIFFISMLKLMKEIIFSKIRYAMLEGKCILNLIDELKKQE